VRSDAASRCAGARAADSRRWITAGTSPRLRFDPFSRRWAGVYVCSSRTSPFVLLIPRGYERDTGRSSKRAAKWHCESPWRARAPVEARSVGDQIVGRAGPDPAGKRLADDVAGHARRIAAPGQQADQAPRLGLLRQSAQGG
jgi:hypothetical protein